MGEVLSKTRVRSLLESTLTRLARLSQPCLILLVFTLCLFRISETEVDPDLWGHLKFGGDIWASSKACQADTYSYLSGEVLWINHEWLAETILYLLYKSWGTTGLILFKTGLSFLILGTLYRHFVRSGLRPVRAGFLLVFALLMLLPGVWHIRPQLFTYCFFLGTVILILRAEQGDLRGLWLTIPIVGLWANLHGGVLSGLGVLGIYALARALTRLLKRHSWFEWNVVVPIFLAFVASFLTPYGAGQWKLLLQPIVLVRPEIPEWQAVPLFSPYGLVYGALLLLTSASLFSARHRVSLTIFVNYTAIAITPLLAVRNGPLMAIGTLILTAEYLAKALETWIPSKQEVPRRGSQALWSITSIILAFGLAVLSIPNLRCIRFPPDTDYPVGAVRLLKESGTRGSLAVFFNWGQYVIWHLGPGIRVSIDGRRDSLYSEKIYWQNLNFSEGRDGWDTLVTNHDTHLALVSRHYPIYELMKGRPGWSLAYEDKHSALFVADASLFGEKLKRIGGHFLLEKSPGCFP